MRWKCTQDLTITDFSVLFGKILCIFQDHVKYRCVALEVFQVSRYLINRVQAGFSLNHILCIQQKEFFF